MKITLSQLKRIIKEEVAAVKEVGSALPKSPRRMHIPAKKSAVTEDQRAIEQHCVGVIGSVVVGFDNDFYAQMAANLADRGVVSQDFSAKELMGKLSMKSAQSKAIGDMSAALIVYTESIVSAINELYPEDEM